MQIVTSAFFLKKRMETDTAHKRKVTEDTKSNPMTHSTQRNK